MTPDGAEVLNEVRKFLAAYVAFPTVHALTAVTLWAAHTHLYREFESSPRITLASPEKQCGKSRVLELLELLCPGAEMLAGASAAYLYRRIGAGEPITILLDECDAVWKSKSKTDDSAEALRAIINAGHRRSGTVGRVEQGFRPTRYSAYCPVALAGIGDLPDTILDRSVIIPMRRRGPGETVASFRERITRPEGDEIRQLLADWAESVRALVGEPWPDLPNGVGDRAADVWEPLITVADLAGGEWPDSGREACVAFVASAADTTASDGARLLTDLRDVFGEQDALWTGTILERLRALEESPWADIGYGKELDARGLANRLRPYGVKSRDVRLGDVNRKGYRSEDLWDAWARYLGGVSATSATSATPLASTVADVADVADTPLWEDPPWEEPRP